MPTSVKLILKWDSRQIGFVHAYTRPATDTGLGGNSGGLITAGRAPNYFCAPSAIKVAIQSYLNLLQENNDNNVKVIVLDKLLELRKK